MQEPDKARSDDRGPKTPEFRVTARTYVTWIVILGLIPLIVILRQKRANPGQHLSQHEFIQKLESDLIARATITLDQQSPYLRDIRGRYFKTDAQDRKIVENGKPVEVPFFAQVFVTDQFLQRLLTRPEFDARRPNTLLVNLIWSLGPILLVALLIYFVFIRQIKLAQKRQTPPQEPPKTEIV
jgi:hypothetical protein